MHTTRVISYFSRFLHLSLRPDQVFPRDFFRETRRLRLTTVFLFLFLAASAEGEFILSDQESEVYYRLAVVAGGDISAAEGCLITGHLHSNDAIDLKNGSTVFGNVSATGDVDANGTVSGSVVEEAESLSLPSLLDEAALRDLAQRIVEGDFTITNEIIDDVVFVEGTVRIRGELSGTGTIISTSDIRLEGAQDSDSEDSDSEDSDSEDSDSEDSDSEDSDSGLGGLHLAPETRISLIALRNIRVGKGRPFRGALRAGRDIRLEANSYFEGVMVANRRAHIKRDTTILFMELDTTAPSIALSSPPSGGFTAEARPEIRLRLEDDLSGVRSESAVLTIDGVDRTAEADIYPADIRFRPSEVLQEGIHNLQVVVQDHAENLATSDFSFTIDTNPPSLEITAPVGPVVINDTMPSIKAVFADAGSGVESASIQVSVDGEHILFSCFVESSEIICQPPRLLDGPHSVTVMLTDRAGNHATAEREFEIATDRTPPVVTLENPVQGALLNTTPVRVNGSVLDDLGIKSVRVNDIDVDLDGGRFSLDLPLEEGRNELTVIATDLIGGEGVLRTEVILDTEPPVISVTAPLSGESTNADQVRIQGEITDASGISSVEVEGASVSLDGDLLETVVSLEPGSQTLSIDATDLAGNSRRETLDVTRLELPLVTFTEPPNLSLITSEVIDISGTVRDPGATVVVNGAPAIVTGNTFALTGLTVDNGATRLTAVATASNGLQSTARLTLFRDATPPRITVEDPIDHSISYRSSIAVGGSVFDSAARGIDLPAPIVTVNGEAATVTGDTYLASTVPLVEGENLLTVRASDSAGNNRRVGRDGDLRTASETH